VLFSFIIPTLNEEKAMLSNSSLLNNIRRYLNAELIVVDGGSQDSTVNLARSLSCRLYITRASRSSQLNLGAKHAKGKYLIFLHADTILNNEALYHIKNLSNDTLWGFLNIKLNSNKLKYKILSSLINIRSRLFNYATGDQVIIMKNTFFKNVTGFKDIDLMEDIELTNRLKKICKPALINGLAITSIRRWRNHGFLKTIFLMRLLRILYFLGVSDKFLAKIYK